MLFDSGLDGMLGVKPVAAAAFASFCARPELASELRPLKLLARSMSSCEYWPAWYAPACRSGGTFSGTLDRLEHPPAAIFARAARPAIEGRCRYRIPRRPAPNLPRGRQKRPPAGRPWPLQPNRSPGPGLGLHRCRRCRFCSCLLPRRHPACRPPLEHLSRRRKSNRLARVAAGRLASTEG